MTMTDETCRSGENMMSRRIFSLLAALAVAAFGFVAGPAAAEERPEALIERLGHALIERIKSDPDIRGGDVRKLSALADELVLPHVNFQRMTALAAGRWWRQATPEQQSRLMDEFRAMLLRTYAGAMAAVDDQTIRMKPMRGGADANDVIVRSEIVQPRGEPIQLDYRMQRIDGVWKIYDVSVLGAWMVETYRTQFSQEAARSGVEGLIKSLADRNRQSDSVAGR
jgi:phospholipid transport system substrate-binding protein